MAFLYCYVVSINLDEGVPITRRLSVGTHGHFPQIYMNKLQFRYMGLVFRCHKAEDSRFKLLY